MVSYALVITSLMLGVGRLGDMFGKKRVYLCWASLVFGAGSALCGLATGRLDSLIAFQGGAGHRRGDDAGPGNGNYHRDISRPSSGGG